MPHASQRSLPESAGELQRKILQVRRKARIILLGRALLVAIAADLIYDLLSLGLFVLTGARTYFPPFFFVAWTVFSIYALRKTRLLTFSRSLDRQHRLKDRLTSALRYRTTGLVAAPMVAAQAKESLDAIDFQHLRQSFRFKPWYSLAVIALAMTTMVSIKARFPEHFDPRNIVFRQAARLTDLYRHPGSLPEELAMAPQGTAANGPTDSPAGDAEEKNTEEGVEHPEKAPAATEDKDDAKPKKERAEVVEDKKPPQKKAPPKKTAADRPAPGKKKRVTRTTASEEGGDITKTPAVEATRRPSPLAEKPYRGIAPEPLGFTPGEAQRYIPPIPLFKLLMGEMKSSGLVDPEAITIVPEAYQERYREHIIAYFEKLQSLREEHHGP